MRRHITICVMMMVLLMILPGITGCGGGGQDSTTTVPSELILDDASGSSSFAIHDWSGNIINTPGNSGSGYLNGYHYTQTIVGLDGSFDVTKYNQSVYTFYPRFGDTTMDILAYIPATNLSKTTNAIYTMCKYNKSDGSNIDSSKIFVTLDQTSVNDGWVTLFQGVSLPNSLGVWVSASNVTDESNRYIIYDAIKLVSHP